MEFNLDILEKMIPNVLTVLTQLTATLVLFHFIKKLAWGPIREILKKRADTEQEKLTSAQKLKEESEQINAQAKLELQQAGLEAKKLISVGKDEAERVKGEILAEAKQKSQATLEDARKEIEYEKDMMRGEMRKEMVDVAMTAAEKLIKEKLDADKDRQEIEAFVKEVADK